MLRKRGVGDVGEGVLLFGRSGRAAFRLRRSDPASWVLSLCHSRKDLQGDRETGRAARRGAFNRSLQRLYPFGSRCRMQACRRRSFGFPAIGAWRRWEDSRLAISGVCLERGSIFGFVAATPAKHHKDGARDDLLRACGRAIVASHCSVARAPFFDGIARS